MIYARHDKLNKELVFPLTVSNNGFQDICKASTGTEWNYLDRDLKQ